MNAFVPTHLNNRRLGTVRMALNLVDHWLHGAVPQKLREVRYHVIRHANGPRESSAVQLFHGRPHLPPFPAVLLHVVAVVGPRPVQKKEVDIAQPEPLQASEELCEDTLLGIQSGVDHVLRLPRRRLWPQRDGGLGHLCGQEYVVTGAARGIACGPPLPQETPDVRLVAVHVRGVNVPHATLKSQWQCPTDGLRPSKVVRKKGCAKSHQRHVYTIGQLCAGARLSQPPAVDGHLWLPHL
mmetsp:Transcript_150471/g.262931  ORF Transcript_150471/g.262931 Transcript_150471/m.262931 type:complete len:239 (+) Transcript_150471:211-927(+)